MIQFFQSSGAANNNPFNQRNWATSLRNSWFTSFNKNDCSILNISCSIVLITLVLLFSKGSIILVSISVLYLEKIDKFNSLFCNLRDLLLFDFVKVFNLTDFNLWFLLWQVKSLLQKAVLLSVSMGSVCIISLILASLRWNLSRACSITALTQPILFFLSVDPRWKNFLLSIYCMNKHIWICCNFGLAQYEQLQSIAWLINCGAYILSSLMHSLTEAFNIVVIVLKLRIKEFLSRSNRSMYDSFCKISNTLKEIQSTSSQKSSRKPINLQTYFEKIKSFIIIHTILDALCDLVPIVQFKKREKHLWITFTFSKVATLLKVTLLYGCCSRFLKHTIWNK